MSHNRNQSQKLPGTPTGSSSKLVDSAQPVHRLFMMPLHCSASRAQFPGSLSRDAEESIRLALPTTAANGHQVGVPRQDRMTSLTGGQGSTSAAVGTPASVGGSHGPPSFLIQPFHFLSSSPLPHVLPWLHNPDYLQGVPLAHSQPPPLPSAARGGTWSPPQFSKFVLETFRTKQNQRFGLSHLSCKD